MTVIYNGANLENGGAWKYTKGEILRSAHSSQFWVGLACVIIVLVVSGPFETSSLLSIPQRLAYWTSVSFCTYFITMMSAAPVLWWTRNNRRSLAWNCFLAALTAALPITVFIYTVNTSVLGIYASGISSFAYLMAVCAVMTFAVTFISCLTVSCEVTAERTLIWKMLGAGGVADEQELLENKKSHIAEQAFLQRLPPSKRGDLVSLQAQNHYIEVTTKAGKEMVLMRLSDAEMELRDADGERVHRSWWVARSSIEAIETRNEKAILKLIDGRTVPVSRRNKKSVRAWLPDLVAKHAHSIHAS